VIRAHPGYAGTALYAHPARYDRAGVHGAACGVSALRVTIACAAGLSAPDVSASRDAFPRKAAKSGAQPTADILP